LTLVFISMKFSIVFENSGDEIPFHVVHNQDLISWYVEKANRENSNRFFNNDGLDREIDQRLNDINFAVCKTNEIYWLLCDENFPQNNDLEQYLDQRFLNKQHELWVKSQYKTVDIDALRLSGNADKAKLGAKLHDLYPDDIRHVRMAPVMMKLGYIYPYEEMNMTVHRLEKIFSNNREYSGINKWADLGFENPFIESMTSNLDQVNFSFGYTYVGRQYYNKWLNWDTDLECSDHYNYERLEWSFHLNLGRPQTHGWSPEFIQWTKKTNAKPISTQVPIANIINLENNLTTYRKMLYRNAKQQNAATLILN